MKRSLLAICLLAATVVASHAAGRQPVSDTAVYQALGHCGNPCTIRYNGGGSIVAFEDAANAIRSGARSALIIDGYCGSACMVMADKARPRTCITARAVFGYHRTNFDRPLPLRGDLLRWISSRGGFPAFNGRPGLMSASAASQFWPVCNSWLASR